jgi:hypothetical protein|tara:strand:+ start:185 stop:478 length:294 start_codon:yes stop_codon:yes gene_type:complete
MPIPIENNSFWQIQEMIEKEFREAFRVRMTEKEKTKQTTFPKDHPYMERLDKALKQYSVVKVNDANGAHHGVDYEEMKQEILVALFIGGVRIGDLKK